MRIVVLQSLVVCCLVATQVRSFAPPPNGRRPAAVKRAFGPTTTLTTTTVVQATINNESTTTTAAASSNYHPEPIEIVELSEEEYEYDDTKKKTYDEYLQEFQDLAQRTSQDPTIMDKALQLFDDMFETYVRTDGDASSRPDTEIYNTLLTTLAYSKNEDSLKTLLEIVSRMENADTTGAAQPNSTTYTILMDAYMERSMFDDCLKVQQHDKMYHHNIDLINKRIQCYGRQGNADQAMEILEQHVLNANNNTVIKPNQKTFVHVIRALAKQQQDDVEKTMEHLLHQMDEYEVGSSTDAYNAYLQALDAPTAAKILYTMLDSSNHTAPTPDNISFYHVFRAYYGRKSPTAITYSYKMEQLSNLQIALARTHPPATPNDRTWTACLAALCRDTTSRKLQTAVRAQRVWKHIQEPTSFNAKCLLRACGSDSARTQEQDSTLSPTEKMELYQLVRTAFSQISEPNGHDYANLLRATSTLVSRTSPKRDAMLKAIFQQCCQAGHVSDVCLKTFQTIASDELQLQIFGGYAEMTSMPDEWRRKVAVKG